METTIEVNGKPVKITLTKEQVEQIKKADLKITDRIQGWEDAAQIMGFHPVNDLPYPDPKNERQEAVNAFFVLDVAADAYNENKVPDFSDKNQEKWYEWFNYKGSAFGFSGSYAYYDGTDASTGARLCLLSEEHSIDRAKKFDHYFEKLLTKKQK